jgi:hypothetical protein
VADDIHRELLQHETDEEGGGEAHGWVAEKGWGGTHRGGGVGGGTQPQFHGGEVPLAAGSGQGVEGARQGLHGAI